MSTVYRIFLVGCGLFLQHNLFAQIPDTIPVDGSSMPIEVDTSKVYELFDLQKQPEFPGGEPELMKFLSENLKLPPQSYEENFVWTFAVEFVIDKNGCVQSVKAVKHPDHPCTKAIIRLVESMPPWTPGLGPNGNPVNVRFRLPIRIHPQ